MDDTRTTTVRLPSELADDVEAVARARGTSVNAVVKEALVAEVARAKADPEFMAALQQVIERDRNLLERLAGR
ncbi:MAG: ribbon-helix-helix protein, CopG family [Acidimicrobiales bacterium]